MKKFVNKLRIYAKAYDQSPFGREIEGTKELLKEAADIIEELSAKENIRGFIKKIIEKLEDELYWADEEKRKADVLRFDRKVGYADGISSAIDIISQLAEIDKSNLSGNLTGWIPVEERLPETDKYILLSFSNYTVPVIGRYEEDKNGGTFYIGDDLESCSSHYLFVNAWCPLPKPYEPEEPKQIPTDHFMERFNRVV